MDLRKRVLQHGDVILVAVKEIPEGATKIKIKPGFIVERGEGVHTHVIDDVSNLDVYRLNGTMYLQVKDKTLIDHEEHKAQVLEVMPQEKIIEREWDYESEEARKTLD